MRYIDNISRSTNFLRFVTHNTIQAIINTDFFLWRFDPVPGQGLPLRGFAITFIGRIAFSRTLWTSDKPVAQTST